METETQSVSMRIDADGLVDIARSLWVEGKYVQSYRLLSEGLMGIDDETVFAVIEGTRTLQSTSKGSMMVVPDSWSPIDHYGKGINYPKPSMRFLLDRLAEYEKFSKHFEIIKCLGPLAHSAQGLPAAPINGSGALSAGLVTHASPIGYVAHETVSLMLVRMMPRPTKEEWSVFWKRFGAEIRETMKAHHEARREQREERKLERTQSKAVEITPENTSFYAMRDLKGNVDGAIALQMAMDRWPIPDCDPSMKSKAGWLAPDGRFYPCIYMGHGWLAFKLVEESDDMRRKAAGKDPERYLETAGWVKLAHTNDEVALVHCVFGSRLSKPQAAKIVKWCEIHHASIPLSLQGE